MAHMTKFHVNPDSGEVGRCTASKRPCPLTGAENHFASEIEAKQHSEKTLSKKHPETSMTKKVGRLILYVGLPGSGKSTLAEKLAEETGGVRVNRDDQRTLMYGDSYHNSKPDPKKEAAVTAILRNRMLKALREGRTVIDDNTNTNVRFLAKTIAEARAVGAEVEIRTVDVPLEVAKQRNKKRADEGGRYVPESVIDSMAKNIYSEDGKIKDVLVSKRGYVFLVPQVTPGMVKLAEFNSEMEEKHPIQSKNVVVLDIDGTLVRNQDLADAYLRQPNVRKDFSSFYRDSADAPINQSVLQLVREFRERGFTVMAMTGRTDEFVDHTIKLLRRADAPVSRLVMAREGDYRGDHDTKQDNVGNLKDEGFEIVHAIDDRPTSIEVWNSHGVLVSAVPYGESEHYPKDGSEPQVNSLLIEGFCVRCGKQTDDNSVLHKECNADG